MRANVDAMPHMPAWRAVLARLYTETDQLEQAREQVDILRANGFDHAAQLDVAGVHDQR